MTAAIGHNSGGRWIAMSVDARFHPIIGCGRPVKGADSTREAWSRFEAWVDLICEATWKQREVTNKGRTILLDRGELMAARGWLAQRWNWTEKQVRTFLERLVAEFMISEVVPKAVQQQGEPKVLDVLRQKGQQKQNLVKVLSICNYDLYQTARELNDMLEVQRQERELVQHLDQQKGQQRASKGPDSYLVYKEDTDPPVKRVREIANPPQWEMGKALDWTESEAQHDVAWLDDGNLMVMNGFESELAKNFPRVNLTAGLATVAAEKFPQKHKLSAKHIKSEIVRRFGYMEQDESGKDRRAAARQQKSAQAPPSAQAARVSTNEPDWVKRDRRMSDAAKNFDWGKK